MADVKISALATATTSIGTTIAVVEGGVTKKVVVASAFDYLLSNDGNGGQPPAPKPTNTTTIGFWSYVGSRTTPNIAGALYSIICFDVSNGFVGALANVSANTDVAGAGAPFTSTTQMMYWRTA